MAPLLGLSTSDGQDASSRKLWMEYADAFDIAKNFLHSSTEQGTSAPTCPIVSRISCTRAGIHIRSSIAVDGSLGTNNQSCLLLFLYNRDRVRLGYCPKKIRMMSPVSVWIWTCGPSPWTFPSTTTQSPKSPCPLA